MTREKDRKLNETDRKNEGKNVYANEMNKKSILMNKRRYSVDNNTYETIRMSYFSEVQGFISSTVVITLKRSIEVGKMTTITRYEKRRQIC